MDDNSNSCGCGKRKKSNLSIKCKSKKYRLDASKNIYSSSQTSDTNCSKSDSDQNIETNALSQSTTQSNTICTQMVTVSVCKSQQTVQECKDVYVVAKPVTFIKSTQCSHSSKLYISTQTCSPAAPVIKHLKPHSTETSTDDPIAKNYPCMKRVFENGLFLEFLHKIDRSNQLHDFLTVIESIACGNLPTLNIAWKCILYRAKWAMCKTTTTMKFNHEYVEIFCFASNFIWHFNN